MHHIQQLAPDDVSLLQELNTLFGEVFGEPETYCRRRPGEAYLRSLLAREHVVALVAVADRAVVGGLVAYELLKFEQERRELYICDLAVAEAHRRHGIATALIRRLQDVAARRGAYVIYVQADHGDDPAIALYTKLGTREDVLHFDIAVPARS
jgi:aminoglycoside 3-N-acetyltransferase I